jgi:protein SCO1
MRWRRPATGLAAGLVLLCALSAPASSQSRWRGDYFPNVTLVTDEGRSVRFYDDLLHNKVVAINFIFTSCPDVCPMDTAHLRRVQELLGARAGRDVHLYSITVDPARDTPAVLQAYKRRFDVGPGWTFLTGAPADIALIQRKLGLIVDDDNDPRDHSTSVILGNEAAGQWIKRSPYDNPQGLADLLTGSLSPRVVGDGVSRSAVPYAAAQSVSGVSRGEYLFRTRCAACHTIGGGEGLGPDVAHVSSRRTRGWLVRWIKEPDKMLRERDPTALGQLERYRGLAMPNLGLNDVDANALIAFIDAESATTSQHHTKHH